MVVKKSTAVAKTARAKTAKAQTGKSPTPRAAAAQMTITLKQIGVQLAQSHDLPKREVDALLDDVIAAIAKHLKKGAKVRLSGLGILEVKKRAARTGRNPATGDAIKIKASKRVSFRIASDLKATL